MWCNKFRQDTQAGSHWVAYYNNPKLNYVEFIDPFGEYKLTTLKRPIIPELIVKFLRSGKKKNIMYNDSFIQAQDSSKCGCYCIAYIKSRYMGLSPQTTLAQFTDFPSTANEQKVLQYYI